ncbi:MAG: pyridoxamine 5'-phosphate oxidase [Oscillochloris sp.]|nr:pyridoxamine 5'-phosphate oxidase [Oscillochloris sp.]
MDTEARTDLRRLIDDHRQAALATLADGAPALSMVLYAVERNPERSPAFLIHVSKLAAHTGQLMADPRAALLIAAPDIGAVDPQTLARVSIQATAQPIARDGPDFAAARGAYLDRLPQQAYLFDFPDFVLFRLEPLNARYVGGFARAFSLDAARLAAILARP